MRLLITEPLAGRPAFLDALRREAPGVEIQLWADDRGLRPADILVAWDLPADLDLRARGIRLVFCFGAGTEQILEAPNLPPELPVARLLDAGQAQRMSDYAALVVLERAFNLPELRTAQRRRDWAFRVRPLDRRDLQVCILGLGFVGSRIASRLTDEGFPVRGWSRQPRDLPGVITHAGFKSLDRCLGNVDVLIAVLPSASGLSGVLNADRLQQLAPGAFLANMGRGSNLDEAGLRTALDAGAVAHAWLDVASPEPPAADSWLWTDERVTLTPHISGMPSDEGSALSLANAIKALRQGSMVPGTVRRSS